MPFGAVDIGLGQQRERHAVGARAERLDLLDGARFLAHELIAGHPDHRQPALGVVTRQVLQRRVLRGEAAFGGDIDDQHRAVRVVLQRGGLAVQSGQRDIGEAHDDDANIGPDDQDQRDQDQLGCQLANAD